MIKIFEGHVLGALGFSQTAIFTTFGILQIWAGWVGTNFIGTLMPNYMRKGESTRVVFRTLENINTSIIDVS